MTATAETYDLTIDGSAASTPKAPGTPSPRSTNSRLSTAIAERRHELARLRQQIQQQARLRMSAAVVVSREEAHAR